MKTTLFALGTLLAVGACGLLACSSSSSTPAGGGDDGGAGDVAVADSPAEAAHEAAAPSPFAGTWSCAVNWKLTFTTPITTTTMGGYNQTVTVVDNGDGTITATAQPLDDAGNMPCALKYTVSGTTATLASGQSCMISNSGAMLTSTFTMGTSMLMGTTAATTQLAYMFTGTEMSTPLDGGPQNIMVGGTGVETDMCNKQ